MNTKKTYPKSDLFSKSNFYKDEKFLIFSILYIICFFPILSFSNTVGNSLFGDNFSIDSITVFLGLIFFISISLFIILLKHKFQQTHLILILFITGYLINFIVYPDLWGLAFTNFSNITANPFFYFIIGLVSFLIALKIKNFEIFYIYLVFSSKLIIPLSILEYFYLINDGREVQYLVYSYKILLFITVLLLRFFESKDWTAGIIGLFGLLFILLIGSRGAFVSCISSILVFFILGGYFNLRKKIIMFFTSTFLLIVLWLNIENIIFFLVSLANRFQLNSRTLSLIVEGNVTIDSGRTEIISKFWNNLSFFGEGLYSDYVDGSYAHNLFVEILYQWGIIYGTIVIAFILYFFLKGIRSSDPYRRFVIISLLSVGFFKLMFSNSYLMEVNFWILLGFCLSSLKKEDNFRYNLEKLEPTHFKKNNLTKI